MVAGDMLRMLPPSWERVHQDVAIYQGGESDTLPEACLEPGLLWTAQQDERYTSQDILAWYNAKARSLLDRGVKWREPEARQLRSQAWLFLQIRDYEHLQAKNAAAMTDWLAAHFYCATAADCPKPWCPPRDSFIQAALARN